jgi:hypothetical protein
MAASTMVTKRTARFEKIFASADANLGSIAETVLAELSPFVKEGEDLSREGIEVFLRTFVRWFGAKKTKMVEADTEHNRELGEDTVARTNFDISGTKGYEALRDFKEAARSAHGQELIEELQVSGTTPVDSRKIGHLLGFVLGWFNNPEKALPPAKSALAPALDRETIITYLTPIHKKLDEAITGFERELKETEVTMIAKNAAMAQYDRAERATLGVFYTLMIMAGLTEVADRLSPVVYTTTSSVGDGSTEPVTDEGSTTPSDG